MDLPEAVDVAWPQLREPGREEADEFPEFGAVEAAYVRPGLRTLLPFKSMWRLGFRPSVVGHALKPAVLITQGRGSGTFRVQRTLCRDGAGALIAEVSSAAEAATLAEAHAPADLGPDEP
ncbi:DUF6193 family natural product biosynthesis protein [Kitasatospora purpeofusca]|uniref:DUF6193 family natural product biosynthesis protein n=1 Tax=Kitasatospora purpeofusca TaxID=67352 RepID=UPI0022521E45|nr:DUF6193 family natural product biosynthesis protein [Kitasatospora purpeofusca]MCX4684304.1 DUF6193 family natural product biosynthesis protein [Kitasatospora purpeofusca]